MASRITGITAGIVTLGALLGLVTAVSADDKNKRVKLPAKSCTWVAFLAKDTKVVASGGTHTEADGTKWKCSDGNWSQVPTTPQKAKT